MGKDINPNEIRFSPSSYCSRDGRLFEYQDGLYRAITPDRSNLFSQMFESGLIDRLVNKGMLIETRPAEIHVPGYGLVVQHRKVTTVTYPFEWCNQALKDAALFLLDLNLELLKKGMLTHDVHSWNILFEGTKPVFVDLGSIKPLESIDKTRWIEDYYRFYIRPLQMFSADQARIARLCLEDWRGWSCGVLQEDFTRLMEMSLGRRFLSKQSRRFRNVLPLPFRLPFRGIRRALSRTARSHAPRPSATGDTTSWKITLAHLEKEVSSVKFAIEPQWDYYRELFTFPSFADSRLWTSKHQNVASILAKTKPASVIDIGSNRGWYSQLAAANCANVIALDMDETLVSRLYVDAKSRGLPLQALVVNFIWPFPGGGLLDFWTPAVRRLNCEMAMALALVHHLVHRDGLHFDHIVEGLSRFTSRWLLTEFIPYVDEQLSTWKVEKNSWYSLENFLAALKERFNIVSILESDPSQRVLIFCEKRHG